MKLPELLEIASVYFDRDITQYFIKGQGLNVLAFLEDLHSPEIDNLLKNPEAICITILNEVIKPFLTEFEGIERSNKENTSKVSQTYYKIIIDTIYNLNKIKFDYKELTYKDAYNILKTDQRNKAIEILYKYKSKLTDKEDLDDFNNGIKDIEDKDIDYLYRVIENYERKLSGK